MRLKEMPDIMGIREVAEILRVSVLTVKRMGKRGDIKFMRINSRGDRRYKRKDIINFINNQNEF